MIIGLVKPIRSEKTNSPALDLGSYEMLLEASDFG